MVHSFDRACGVSLRELLDDARLTGADEIRVNSCCSDSRRVKPGDLFVALPGVEHDGHDFYREALERGASAFLVERPLPVDGMPMCVVSDVRHAHGQLCQAMADNPSSRLKVIGITGTNGKTTSTALAAHVLAAGGASAGTIGTLGLCDTQRTAQASLTTPPPTILAQWLGNMLAAGCSHAVLEVSSHALSQSRTAGIEFDAVCFTNIRRDHLDYHGSLTNYRRAKAKLLDQVSPDGVVILNVDDPECVRLLPRVHNPVLTVGLSADAQVSATLVERHLSEQTFLLTAGSETVAVRTAMIGNHHIANCLTATALGLVYGIDLATIARGLERLTHVAGRMERIECGQSFGVFVDYAHTPDALETALETLREVTSGRLICVFGAGGDRDRKKRMPMGRVVERHADLAVVTTDNPRGEDPQGIARDVLRGFERPQDASQILDRTEAICWALGQAERGDTVLIAGKGHETYQVVGSRRYYFDDREVARDFLYRQTPQEANLWPSPS